MPDPLIGFRLRGQRLDRRVPRTQLVKTIGEIGGLHAQLMSSAELESWVRLKGSTPEDLRRALWDERSAAKTWLMRGTLHVVPAGDLSLYTAAIGTDRLETPYFLKHIGVTTEELERVVETVAEVLDGEVLTRAEVSAETDRRLGGRKAPKRPDPAWAWFLRIAGLRGELCYGPHQGRSVTFTRPSSWLGKQKRWAREDARVELLRRYLHAHGPASPEDYAWWLDMGPVSRVRAAWSALESELEELEPARWALASDGKRLRARGVFDRVRLLPAFDPALLGHRDRSHIVDEPRYATIYRKAAWVTPAVLVDGRIAGTWSYAVKGKRLRVEARPFARFAGDVREAIAAEAEDLGRFLGAEAELGYARA
ncbi:MAG: winged helix DNA-binding domain-containing protein [Actinomycetota bacterium]